MSSFRFRCPEIQSLSASFVFIVQSRETGILKRKVMKSANWRTRKTATSKRFSVYTSFHYVSLFLDLLFLSTWMRIGWSSRKSIGEIQTALNVWKTRPSQNHILCEEWSTVIVFLDSQRNILHNAIASQAWLWTSRSIIELKIRSTKHKKSQTCT